MTLSGEIDRFDVEVAFLEKYKRDVYRLDFNDEPQKRTAEFLAESLLFRLFRAQERLVRAIFLDTCTTLKTFGGKDVASRLKCETWDEAEELLKSNSKFLDWGNAQSTATRANLVFPTGYPVSDLLAPIHTRLVDLHRVRNFISHDSKEALSGFKKACRNYLAVGESDDISAGELLIYRKRPSDSYVFSKFLKDVGSLTAIYKGI